MLLIGFWQGFRSDVLSRITVENVTASLTDDLSLFLAYSKTDSDAKGKVYTIPKLNHFCPTEAYLDWLEVSGIKEGVVFRKVDRWGNLASTGINKQSTSLTELLMNFFQMNHALARTLFVMDLLIGQLSKAGTLPS